MIALVCNFNNYRDLRTRGNWWNLNVSQTLYSQRMQKKIAKLNLEESRMKAKLSLEERKREAAMADLHRIGGEDDHCMAEDLQRFDQVKTCGGLWG